MRRLLGVLAAATLAAALAPVPAQAIAGDTARATRLGWSKVDIDTGQQLRGLAAVDARTAWVGGSKGGVWRTVDAGKSWRKVSPPGSKGLLFRDVEATDADHAQVLAIGEGTDSRIYRTADGGRSWTKTFVNRSPRAFYDCMAMWPDGRHGLAMSDPVKGRFRVISTRDGGRSWSRVDPEGMPQVVEGEFGFAASGTCLVTNGSTDAYLASGGTAARIYATRDRGLTWTVRDSTLPATPAGGVFSLAFRDGSNGIAVGGDFEAPTNGVGASASTSTAGRSWKNGGDLGGYRSGVDFRSSGVAVAVGPTGSDVSTDGGRTWRSFSHQHLDAVQCVAGACWASGPEGRVARLVER
jgi:photosystem II stability/assembly factor-like uncharacterized protein